MHTKNEIKYEQLSFNQSLTSTYVFIFHEPCVSTPWCPKTEKGIQGGNFKPIFRSSSQPYQIREGSLKGLTTNKITGEGIQMLGQILSSRVFNFMVCWMKLIDLGTRLRFLMINCRNIWGKVGIIIDINSLSWWCRDEKVEDWNEHVTMDSFIKRKEHQNENLIKTKHITYEFCLKLMR